MRSVTRELFLEEKKRQVAGAALRRRPESDIRDEFVLALNVSITDAIYQRHPAGLKHDIFALPDPDVAVIARKLKYDSALQVAERVRTAFRAEAAHLVSKAGDDSADVSLLVASLPFLDPDLVGRGSAEIHHYLRGRLKSLKEEAGRGRVYGREALTS